MRRLDKTNRDAIIRKICDRNTASKLIEKMSVNSNLSEIVDTPLFATLLCIVYRAELRLPETIHEFYDMVFQTLLYRHDQQKEGYERPRKSGLGNHQFSVVFEYFCIQTSLEQRLRLSQEDATEIFATALAKEGSEASLVDKYFNDVVKITCLLVKDGTDYQFLHKSIQEYFAARYIKRLPEGKAQEFYRRIIDSPSRIAQLKQTIYFLYEIDSYRAYKYFALPSMLAAFSNENDCMSEAPIANCSGNLVLETLAEVPVAIGFRPKGAVFDLHSIHYDGSIPYNQRSLRRVLLEHFDLLLTIITSAAELIAVRLAEIDQPILEVYFETTDSIGIRFEWPTTSLNLKFASCSKVTEALGLQDEIARIVNSSDVWERFLARVNGMVGLLQRIDSTDLLDIM
jgi:hypothetical protein